MRSAAGGSTVPPTALGGISAAILNVEADFDLLRREVDGAPFWQRVRFEVHRRVLVESGTMGSPEPTGRTSLGWLSARLRALRASVWSSAFGRIPECDVLFAGTGRRVLDPEWGWCSPHCGLLARGCGVRPLVVEHHVARWGPAAPGVPTRYLDRTHAWALRERMIGNTITLPADGASLLGAVATALRQRTGVSIDLAAMVRADLTSRRVGLAHYRRLLERCGARVVVVECSYDKHTLVEAARAMSLPVVEIQHGVLSRHHFGYHFPEGSGAPSCFPDWFLAWGGYWRSAAAFPLPPERVLPVGFPRFDRELALGSSGEPGRAGTTGGSADILFLSQAMLGETLSRFAAEAADRGLRDRIVFRLHPREEQGWRTRYPWLAEAGVRVSGSEEPLYPRLRAAPIHVGTFSTALFEGLALGARVYLVPAPGIEYMQDLLERGHAALATSPAELASLVGDDPVTATRASDVDLFRPGALERTCAALRAIAGGESPDEAVRA
jgi:hypothetical protein